MAITNTLPLDVRPKLRDHLMTSLYKKDTDMAEEILIGIVDEHRRITGSFTTSFMYLNRVHTISAAPKPIIAEPLHPDLYERMNLYLADRIKVEREEKLIVKNLFTAMMNYSDSPEDWERMLPPAMKDMIQAAVWSQFQVNFGPARHTDGQIEVWQNKQERALNMLKGRLALNLIF